jgi:HAD superfamily hydrolase (TIGR01458 family)
MDIREFRGWLFDIEGVLLDGPDVLQPNIDFVRTLIERHVPVLFVTNTVTRSKDELVNRFTLAGLPVRADQIVTPIDGACEWLIQRNIKKIHVVAPKPVQNAFSVFQLDESGEALVIGDFGTNWQYRELNHAFQWMMLHPDLPVLALGGGRYYRRQQQWFLDLGAFTQALSWAANRTIQNCGKPDRLIFEAAARKLGLQNSEVVMVGDDYASDVNAAIRAGCQGILVRSGKYRVGDEKFLVKEAMCIDSLASFSPY